MKPNQIKVFYLIKKLRFKYQKEMQNDDTKVKAIYNKTMLQHIIDHSYSIAYPNWDIDGKALSKADQARKKRKYRIKKYIDNMFVCYEKDLYFTTLTFRDDVLSHTQERTRYLYVQQFLNELSKDYIANQDHGSLRQREHYHAVVALDSGKLKMWDYGFIQWKPIKEQNSSRISKYICKLSNHAGKLGTGKCFHKRGMKEVDALPF